MLFWSILFSWLSFYWKAFCSANVAWEQKKSITLVSIQCPSDECHFTECRGNFKMSPLFSVSKVCCWCHDIQQKDTMRNLILLLIVCSDDTVYLTSFCWILFYWMLMFYMFFYRMLFYLMLLYRMLFYLLLFHLKRIC